MSNTDNNSEKLKEGFFSILFLKGVENEHFSNRR